MSLDYRQFMPVFTLLLAGCAIPPNGPLSTSFESAQAAEEISIDPTFEPGMNALVEDKPHTGGSWESDDWLLLGVKVSHETGQDVWLVRLTSLRPEDPTLAPEDREFAVPFGLGAIKTGTKFTAPVGKVMVETFDQSGEALRSSIRTIPHVVASASILDVLEETSPRRSKGPTTQANATVGVVPSEVSHDKLMHAITVIEMMSGARALVPIRDAIREHVIHKPSVLAVVMNGFRLNVEALIDRNERPHFGDSQGKVVHREEARFPLLLAGQRLFDCRVIAGPTDSPFNLIAGALILEAVNPEKPDNRLTVCVLAAKRGTDSQSRAASR